MSPLPIGSENKLPDIEVTGFDVPTFAIVGKPVRLPFTISSALPTDYTITVEVITESGEKLIKDVTVPAMGKLRDYFSWKPLQTGDTNLTISVPVASSERDRTNNEMSAPIAIRKERLRVLVIESFPRWEYRYLRAILKRDPRINATFIASNVGMVHQMKPIERFPESPKPWMLNIRSVGKSKWY